MSLRPRRMTGEAISIGDLMKAEYSRVPLFFAERKAAEKNGRPCRKIDSLGSVGRSSANSSSLATPGGLKHALLNLGRLRLRCRIFLQWAGRKRIFLKIETEKDELVQLAYSLSNNSPYSTSSPRLRRQIPRPKILLRLNRRRDAK